MTLPAGASAHGRQPGINLRYDVIGTAALTAGTVPAEVG